ncbi:uncharacterized protein [Ptychodera flava]|uniref:uncharacterized protein isoform X2 n=1 Tax=Ptychodera flava TaxID=63121 RepID=UPI003969EF79
MSCNISMNKSIVVVVLVLVLVAVKQSYGTPIMKRGNVADASMSSLLRKQHERMGSMALHNWFLRRLQQHGGVVRKKNVADTYMASLLKYERSKAKREALRRIIQNLIEQQERKNSQQTEDTPRKRNVADTAMSSILQQENSNDIFRRWLLSNMGQLNNKAAGSAEKRTMADALNSQIMSQGASNLRGQAFLKILQNLRKQYGDLSVRVPQSKRVTADAFMNSQLRKQFFNNNASALKEAILARQRQGKRSDDDLDEIEKRNTSDALLSTLLSESVRSKFRDAARQAILSRSVSLRAGRPS